MSLLVHYCCFVRCNVFFSQYFQSSSVLSFEPVRRKNEATAVAVQQIVKMIIGVGSSILSIKKLIAAKSLARKLQMPRAVAAKSVGKKY